MDNCFANGHAETVVMIFSGEYDLTSRALLQAAFESMYDAPSVTLDLTKVTYIDSTVISELVRMHNARSASGLERETIVVGNRAILKLLDILNFSEVFRVVDSLDDAINKDGKNVIVKYASSFNGKVGLPRNGSFKRATA